MRRFLFILMLVPFYMPALPQAAVLKGRVTDKSSGEALPAVSVQLRSKGETAIRAFTRTDADGCYTMKYDDALSGKELVFTMMGYETCVTSIVPNRNKYDAALKEQATKLREVIVKAPSISMKGDTVLYNVAKYAGVHDRTIGDVLKKMPGIDVAENGAISYNGQQINKFYIEGKDLLGGRYGLATNTVHQEDVATVEVMENHQPIRVLEDVSFSQSPAINLRLKSRARSAWAGTVKAAGGVSPALWQGELSLMRFAKEIQTLDTYKTNNTGSDLSHELADFSIDDLRGGFGLNYSLHSFIDVNPSALSQLEPSRSRFNKTHMVSTNNLVNISKDIDLPVNASYMNNALTADNGGSITYFFNDGSSVTTEDEAHESLGQDVLNIEIPLRANLSTLYLENNIKANLQWNSSVKNFSGTYPNKSDGSLISKQVSDKLQFIKRFGRNIFELRSFNMYHDKPQRLTVTRNDCDGGSVTQRQVVNTAAFFTDTYTSLGFVMSPFTVSGVFGVTGMNRTLDSHAYGLPDSLGTARNDIRMTYWRVYFTPVFEVRNNNFGATLRLPLSYTFYHFNGGATAGVQDKSKPQVSAMLNLEYGLTSSLKVNVSGAYRQAEVDEQSFYQGLVMSDYRNLSTGWINYDCGMSADATVGISYEQPLSALFSRMSFSYMFTDYPWISSRCFVGNYIVNGFTKADGRSSLWQLSWRLSKGIDAIKATLTLDAGYSLSDSYLYQDFTRTDYNVSTVRISPSLKMKPLDWLSVEYSLDYDYMQLKMPSAGTSYGLDNLSHCLKCDIIPCKEWLFSVTAEHYYNEIAEGTAKHTFLMDASITRVFKHFEVNLSGTNLLDNKRFTYVIYDGVSRTYRSFNIRPRNIMFGVFFQF